MRGPDIQQDALFSTVSAGADRPSVAPNPYDGRCGAEGDGPGLQRVIWGLWARFDPARETVAGAIKYYPHSG